MPTAPSAGVHSSRDLRIDWLRGLAMTCVIVNHSKLSSLLSWFSYERFWLVTAAEVFVVLSGIVLGMVYGRRLARDGWLVVVRRLGRRALLLYASVVLVTVSVLLLSFLGIDVRSVSTPDARATLWFLDPRQMDAGAWRDVLLMRHGPWPFEIVGLYVWLVAAAVPCLIVLRFGGWRVLLAGSWILYFTYRLVPLHITSADFEAVFPTLAWQLLFVHGLAIGYHRDRVAAAAARWPRALPVAAGLASIAFGALALCNPWADGPAWLRWEGISASGFSELYAQYFGLTELGFGRLANLAVGLPIGYVVLTWAWTILRPLERVFVTLGQRSLGAFVLHVYGILLLAHVPHADDLLINTVLQVVLVGAIAALLYERRRWRAAARPPLVTAPQPLAA